MVEQISENLPLPNSLLLLLESARNGRGRQLDAAQCVEAANFCVGMSMDLLHIAEEASKLIYDLALYEEKYGMLTVDDMIVEGEIVDTADTREENTRKHAEANFLGAAITTGEVADVADTSTGAEDKADVVDSEETFGLDPFDIFTEEGQTDEVVIDTFFIIRDDE